MCPLQGVKRYNQTTVKSPIVVARYMAEKYLYATTYQLGASDSQMSSRESCIA
jgi:hypothetical protein